MKLWIQFIRLAYLLFKQCTTAIKYPLTLHSLKYLLNITSEQTPIQRGIYSKVNMKLCTPVALIQWFLSRSDFVYEMSGTLDNILRALVITSGSRVMSLVPSEWKPGKLLNIIQCIGQIPLTKNYLAPNAMVLRLGHPALMLD